MAAVMSQKHPSTSPPNRPGAGANAPPLPPIVTSPPPPPRARLPSYASKRLSTFSTASGHQPKSRPQSTVFPIFHSSLSYTLVRDFAYKANNPLFYGPLPEQHSEVSTPASESHRRLSDPQPSWEQRGRLATSWDPGEQLPQTSFDPRDDGPPYSEDEDIHSPVVTSSRHKKHKSNVVDFDRMRRRNRSMDDGRPITFTGINGDGSQTYYLSEMDESANGPGGEYITYPPRHLHDQAMIDDDDDTMHNYYTDEHRYSRDYQFTITDPAEEMHGKAVALYDFTSENDNELPLVEGQVILVSYRKGQGWLVAQDPKTGESGLVPEEYVRLLRDIEGGWSGLMNGQLASPGSSGDPYSPNVTFDNNVAHTTGHVGNSIASPISVDARTPTRENMTGEDVTGEHPPNSAGYYPPVVSTFSTSSKDLHPYPQHLLGASQLSPPASAGQEGGFPKKEETAQTGGQG